jgi:ABC-type uncharacterized transport system ATPase subunit
LECRDIHVRFAGFPALRGVSLDVVPGEVHVLVGPNGAGKTTLANVVTGHSRQQSGTVSFEGRPLTGAPWRRARRGIGRKFQVPRVVPRLDRAGNLTVAGGEPVRGGDDTWAVHLSHGERQRLELDMVARRSPRLVVLDEPTAGMPYGDRRRLAELIAARDASLGYLVVEHDLEFVKSIATRVSFLMNGELLLTDDYDEVRRDPRVLEAYIGAPLTGEQAG